eukprot:557794-Prymnesium_polylepis.1
MAAFVQEVSSLRNMKMRLPSGVVMLAFMAARMAPARGVMYGMFDCTFCVRHTCSSTCSGGPPGAAFLKFLSLPKAKLMATDGDVRACARTERIVVLHHFRPSSS